MFHNFGFEVSELLQTAEEERIHLKHPYVGSEHLLLAILKKESNLSTKLRNYGLTYKTFKNELCKIVGSASKLQDLILYTPLLKRIIEMSLEDANENNKGIVTEEHLFVALLEEGEGIAIRIMLSMDVDLEELYDDMKSRKIYQKERENLEIYKIGTVLNDQVNEEEVIGREKEISLMIETLLRKKKNNPLLIGKAGVGKTAIVEELTRRIKKNQVPEELLNQEIVMLEMGSLVAGTKYRGEFEERLTKVIKEVIQNKNIIIFIDEIHSMVNAGGAEGAINASDILKPYLARGELRVIGATTTEEYYKYIEKDKALERRFELIKIEEPNQDETKEILKHVKKEYELHHHLTITDENISDIVELANRYIFNKNNPDKALELLDSVCAKVKNQHKILPVMDDSKLRLESIQKKKEKVILAGDFEKAIKIKKEEEQLKKKSAPKQKQKEQGIEKQDILEVIEKKTGIPVLLNKKEQLTKLKTTLQEQIIGQKDALDKIIHLMEYKKENKKPLSALLLGSSGVGKTETVKQIAKIYGGPEDMIRLDMSEYNLDTSIHKLIGTPGGYVGYGEPFLFQKLKTNPYRVILVDELEKANAKIWNLFLQILDEGFITDSCGDKIRFDHAMIFMTSNIEPKEKVGFIGAKNSDLEDILSKELIGRFDTIVEYKKLNKDDIREFINRHKESEDLDIDQIISESEYEKYGLRNIMHLIEKYENGYQTN